MYKIADILLDKRGEKTRIKSVEMPVRGPNTKPISDNLKGRYTAKDNITRVRIAHYSVKGLTHVPSKFSSKIPPQPLRPHTDFPPTFLDRF